MPRKINEELTRKEMIDPQLETAGWYLRDHSKVKTEIPVDGYDAEPWNGISDYTLYRENGEVLAVVEAKRTSVDVRLAEAQLTHYVTEIEKHQRFRPFGFLANGFEIYFVDVGISAKREVFGFFTREDLENLLYIRQNAKPLSSVEINNKIVDRSYQHEAIRACGEKSFAKGQTKALDRHGNRDRQDAHCNGIDRCIHALQPGAARYCSWRTVMHWSSRQRTDGFENYLPNEPCTRIRSLGYRYAHNACMR